MKLAWTQVGPERPPVSEEVSGGFVAQLDVDGVSLKEWPDAGLAGCIYVFDRGKRRFALWQYT